MPTIDDGRHAIEQGNLQQARLIFEAILQETPRSEEAWLGLAEVLTESDDKRICYENVLKINKNNRPAREGLRNLEPQANPLIAALRESAASRIEEDSDDATMISQRPVTDTVAEQSIDAAQAEEGPPMYTLVAIGLVLSVLVFAILGGVVFFLLNSLSGG